LGTLLVYRGTGAAGLKGGMWWKSRSCWELYGGRRRNRNKKWSQFVLETNLSRTIKPPPSDISQDIRTLERGNKGGHWARGRNSKKDCGMEKRESKTDWGMEEHEQDRRWNRETPDMLWNGETDSMTEVKWRNRQKDWCVIDIL
jgi:hypothetical protein